MWEVSQAPSALTDQTSGGCLTKQHTLQSSDSLSLQHPGVCSEKLHKSGTGTLAHGAVRGVLFYS